MPELAEVETFRRRAHAVLAGQRVDRVWVREDALVFQGLAPDAVRARLEGCVVTDTGRRGKQAWLTVQRQAGVAEALMLHFGMTGAMQARADGAPGRFDRLVLSTAHGHIAFATSRRIARAVFVPDGAAHAQQKAPGLDVSCEPVTPVAVDALFAAMHKSRRPVKTMLLDQRLWAGVGNWLADDILRRAQISPHRRGPDLTRADVEALCEAARFVIQAAIDVDADETFFDPAWLFHVRWTPKDGVVTADGHPVQFDRIGGRTTAWLPSLQR